MDRRLIVLIALMALAVPTFAFGPISHVWISKQFTSSPEFLSSSSPAKTIIQQNEAYFLAGGLTPDISVVYYLTEGGKRYESLHSWSFSQCLHESASNDRYRAFAYGVEYLHYFPDGYSHNVLMPQRIRGLFVPNIPIHPTVEASWEALVIRDHPEIYEKTRTALQPVLNDPQLIRIIQNCVDRNPDPSARFDVKKELIFFDEVLGNPNGFYTRMFKLPDIYQAGAYGSWSWGLGFLALAVVLFLLARRVNESNNVFIRGVGLALLVPILIMVGLLGLLMLSGGLVRFANESEFHAAVDETVRQQLHYFQPQNYNKRFEVDPSGFSLLRAADNSITFVWTLSVVLILAFVGFVIWKLRKRRRGH